MGAKLLSCMLASPPKWPQDFKHPIGPPSFDRLTLFLCVCVTTHGSASCRRSFEPERPPNRLRARLDVEHVAAGSQRWALQQLLEGDVVMRQPSAVGAERQRRRERETEQRERERDARDVRVLRKL